MINVKNNIHKKLTRTKKILPKTYKNSPIKMRLYKHKQRKSRKFNKLKC